eukprot:CAMPEP_0203683524 /NCGR_PEP_ID=MMETSP0090-20130426/47569_1 /ASSEMBLY_ACC=CAM_ASM_001088 /TAXON_ID=426623 /ORGANISM="Chaetoceros affinis, Strain CCMP159" /LENGTH=400 /DNA_ID=CAMNT_0050552673 /DNA_START=374 /DNA_END=1576 /DNA_ORIENTATION=-
MAFDRPLEADRVDDLGLLSTFVRAPIVGPIMWILGKKLAENNGEEEKENTLSIVAASAKAEDANECPSSSSSSFQLSRAKGSFPDIASSSISDIMNSVSLEEDRGNNSNNAANNTNNSSSSGKQTSTSTNSNTCTTDEETKHNEAFNSFHIRKKSRKMSWSDESGQSLVEYCDLSQSSTNHNQNTPPTQSYPTSSYSKRPIKSAMRRSTGNNSNNNGGGTRKPTTNRFHPSQCVPSGLSGGSIIMPSGGGLQQGPGQQQYQQQQQHQQQQQPNNGNGYISPQYGWYISMTPPTPPHYPEVSSSSSSTKATGKRESQQQQQQEQHVLQQSQLNGKMYPPQQHHQIQQPQHHHYILPMTNNNGVKPVSHVLGQHPPAPPRPVFTRSLKGVPNNTSGWPSVPL